MARKKNKSGKGTRSNKKTTSRAKRSAKRGSANRRSSASRPADNKVGKQTSSPPSIVSGLSLDRKLDLLGVLLTLVGLLTLLFLMSPNRSSLTESWVAVLSLAFGWGIFVLPLGLIGVGLWLILRNFDRVPQLAIERLVGVLLLFIHLLSSIHFLTFPPDSASSYALAAEGSGGGYLGAITSELLLVSLGFWGTVVALLAWMLIGIMLTFDLSAAELFRWIPPLFELGRRKWAEVWAYRNASKRSPLAVSDGSPEQVGVMSVSGGKTTVENSVAPHLSMGIKTEQAFEWTLPPIEEMLDEGIDIIYNDDYDRERAQIIEETLASFGAPAHVVEINRGPTITLFGVEPDFIESSRGRTRVRVGKISSLADDLALALAASSIRIQAPVPGQGYVGIEVPNDEIALVSLRDAIESEAFNRLNSPLRFALGQDVSGNAVAANLAGMPHLLIAGATGSGKSVCVNGIISCLLLNNTPEDLRILMVDPKRVELTGYNGVPHLLAPVIVETERVIGALQWVMREMDMRYEKFAEAGARNLPDYNEKQLEKGEKKVPYLVVIIDELADLMMLAPDETERSVTRLAQLARATGIHLIISTQRPSVDVVTGLIKANFPARIAFAVSSGVDSRVILDQPGADRLLGRGDMLFQAPDAPAPVRLQGVFVSDREILRIVHYWRVQAAANSKLVPHPGGETLHSTTPVDAPPSGIPLKQLQIWEEMEPEEELDPLFEEAVDMVRRRGRASISMLQRRMRIGYTRAARIIETMEAKRIISEPKGAMQTREVLDYGPAAPPSDED